MSSTVAPSSSTATTRASRYLVGRESELARLVEAAREGELTIVSSVEPALAVALADACSRAFLPDENAWPVIRVDARVCDDVTDLARQLTRAAAAVVADASRLTESGAFETPKEGRARMEIRRALGPTAYALATETEGDGDGPRGVPAMSVAANAVVAARKRVLRPVLLVIHGVDELVRPGRSRFDEGQEALWALRGVWQRAHGPALLTGGAGAAAMAADPKQGFYGYGQLHEVQDLPPDRLEAAYREVLGARADDSAVAQAQALLGHAVWMAPEVVHALPARRVAGAADVREAWQRVVESREAELHGLLRAASRVHRLAVPILKALASGEGPYARMGRRGKFASDISRALLALEACALIHRLGEAQWRLADPALATLLRTES